MAGAFPRVPAALAPNRLARAIGRARADGRPIVDLTLTNPTRAGLGYPPGLLAPLGLDDGLVYDPQPFGLFVARDAVAADYTRRGRFVSPDRIVLTASTSEAYSLLFKLLCHGTGDRVLVPTPRYPLFEHLTTLDGVVGSPYSLEYHGRWAIDLASVDQAWTAGTRAVLAVSPNNPTGSTLTAAELAALDRRCADEGAALIVDEVFSDFPLDEARAAAVPEASPPSALTFRLGGLSKSAALPQVKLGWIAVDGPAPAVAAALEALELICDTYLSVSTPVQIAAPTLIEAGAVMRRQVLDRVRRNHAALALAAARRPAVDLLQADAGWSAVLRVPALRSEEAIVLGLLEEREVLVHPGFFFDFPHEAFLVVSLLLRPADFDTGVARVLEYAGG